MNEGEQRVQNVVLPDGSVARQVDEFLNGAWVIRSKKPLAASIEEFRGRYPGSDITGLVEVAPSPAAVRDSLAALSDEDLSALGLQRKPSEPNKPAGQNKPKDR